MNNDSNNVQRGGTGIVWVAFFILFIMRVTGAAMIPWVWVFSPLWIALGLVLLVLVGILLVGVGQVVAGRREARR